jgi:hypothetical protein
MSDTPKKILFKMMKVSARPFVNARSVAFIVSAFIVPFFLIISIDGFIKCEVASEIPMKQYIIPMM